MPESLKDELSASATPGGQAVQTFTSIAYADLGVPYVQPLRILGFGQTMTVGINAARNRLADTAFQV